MLLPVLSMSQLFLLCAWKRASVVGNGLPRQRMPRHAGQVGGKRSFKKFTKMWQLVKKLNTCPTSIRHVIYMTGKALPVSIRELPTHYARMTGSGNDPGHEKRVHKRVGVNYSTERNNYLNNNGHYGSIAFCALLSEKMHGN